MNHSQPTGGILSPRFQAVLLLAFAFVILLACRTTNLFSGNAPPKSSATRVSAQATRTSTRRPIHTATPAPTKIPPTVVAVQAPPTVLPTEPPPPTDIPPPPPTHKPAPKPQPTATPTDAGPTVTPAPTRCPQQYCVQYRGCAQDSSNTIIEGIVYENGAPKDGVAVRVAKEPGAYPLVDDFLSGTDPINPGAPDPKNPGHYFLLLGAPKEGNWWVFLVDRANGTRQISEAKLIVTQADPYNPANCQHAFVDFVR